MPREYDAYSEQFVASGPTAGKWPWLARVYMYAGGDGPIATFKGMADSELEAKAAAKAAAQAEVEKYRRAPQ